MICRNCGKKNDDSAAFCYYCGAALTQGSVANANPAPDANGVNPAPAPDANGVNPAPAPDANGVNPAPAPNANGVNPAPDANGATPWYTPEPTPAEKKKTNVFAIIGFVLSIAAGAFLFVEDIVYWLALVAGFVLSIIGIVWSKKKNANLIGLAIAGLVLSILAFVGWVFLILFAFLVADLF